MNNIRNEAFIWVQVALVAGLWLLVAFLGSEGHTVGWHLIRELPHVVTAYALITLVFVKWGWRWKIFRHWLVPYPDLTGTWNGNISPVTAAGGSQKAIGATLVIRQTFRTISCTLYTAESESHSTTGTLREIEEGGDIELVYAYLNKPRLSVRSRSELHEGATILNYSRSDGAQLAGQYWTSRLTRGELTFRFSTRDTVDVFEGSGIAP
jgi:hypothetical protein